MGKTVSSAPRGKGSKSSAKASDKSVGVSSKKTISKEDVKGKKKEKAQLQKKSSSKSEEKKSKKGDGAKKRSRGSEDESSPVPAKRKTAMRVSPAGPGDKKPLDVHAEREMVERYYFTEELRDFCAHKGIKVSGNKTALVDRVMKFLGGDTEGPHMAKVHGSGGVGGAAASAKKNSKGKKGKKSKATDEKDYYSSTSSSEDEEENDEKTKKKDKKSKDTKKRNAKRQQVEEEEPDSKKEMMKKSSKKTANGEKAPRIVDENEEDEESLSDKKKTTPTKKKKKRKTEPQTKASVVIVESDETGVPNDGNGERTDQRLCNILTESHFADLVSDAIIEMFPGERDNSLGGSPTKSLIGVPERTRGLLQHVVERLVHKVVAKADGNVLNNDRATINRKDIIHAFVEEERSNGFKALRVPSLRGLYRIDDDEEEENGGGALAKGDDKTKVIASSVRK